MRVSYNGITPGFQPVDRGPTPLTRLIKKFMDSQTIFNLMITILPLAIIIAVIVIYICHRHIDNNTFSGFLTKVGIFNALGASALLIFSLLKVFWS